MGNVDWNKVETIVDEALEQPREKWESYIEKRCGDSPKVKSEVTRLLQSIFDSEGWLEEVESYKYNLGDLALDEDSAPSLIGQQFGAYEAKELIARGGMGTVFRGERVDDDFDHTVAIKVIKMGMNTPENIRLFNRERSILAGLNHPGIAQLFDGGVLENGLPYLIMEYVKGTPIDDYCDSHKLTVQQRIDLFAKVLEAVRYAHENLIIHRDLKPANILITDQGQVKILDFGIAKLLDADDSEDDSNLTVTQSRILTPKYAAPEQIRQKPATTATDIYALGIILYQLLTGSHPYEFGGKSVHELEKVILNSEPTLLHKQLLSDKKSAEIAENRSTTVQALAKELKGDLSAILLKAIEKDPEKRYRTSNELLDEFKKYNFGLPISARQRTLTYRMGKFVRRNRTALSIAAAFILFITSFTYYHTQQITKERNQAQFEAEKAEQVTEFLVSLFGRSNPYLEESDGGTDVSVGSILQFGTEKIDEELANQPNLQAEMKTVLGEVYDALNEYEQAETLLKEAIDIRRNSEQATPAEKANSIRNLAFTYQDQGKYDEAEQLLSEAIVFYEESENGLENHDAISALARLGNLNWYNKGDYNTADSLLNRTLRLREVIHDSNHVHIAINYNDLATLYHSKGDYKTAEPYYRQAIDSYKKLFDEHSNLAIIMANFSALLRERGDYQEAETYQRESLEMHQKLTGEDNLDIALGMGNLGHILLKQNRIDEAETLLLDALDQFNDIFESSHTYSSRTKLNLGKLYLKQKQFDRAQEIITEVQEEYNQLYPENHPRKSDPLLELGRVQMEQQKPDEAQSYFQEALKIREDKYGEDNWRTAQAKSFLGIAYFRTKDFEQAEPLLLESYDILDEKRSKSDIYRTQTLKYIIKLYEEIDNPSKKEEFEKQISVN